MKQASARSITALLAATLLGVGAASAATPTGGTLTESSGPVTFEAGPFDLANPTPVLQVDNGPRCTDPVQPCDSFALTVSLPDDFTVQRPGAVIRFTMSWDDAGTGNSDYDFDVYEGTVADTDGSEQTESRGASTSNPEVGSVRAFDGEQDFTVKVVPFLPTTETVDVKIELVEGDPDEGGGNTGPVAFGEPTPTAPGRPRYQNFFAPDGSAAQGSSGEGNIGFNPASGNIMVMNRAPVFRLTPPQLRAPALPEAGPALWENVSPQTASATTVDPILVTDQDTGRTFMSNQFFGANLLFAHSDDDGESWIEASASPPHGGVDHQTIGVGPYPPGFEGVHPLYPNAVYYCSQTLVPAFCQRSDNGGLSFGPGVPINTGAGCGGLHGHVKVAPNGTVYVPDESCGGGQGASVSTDAGITWSDTVVTDSDAGNGSDPSIALASDSTAYYCYTTGEGAFVAVSHDNGQTWGDSVNISAQAGVRNAVFPQAVAGNPDRAACGFVGTNVPGNFQGLDFPGKWYLFIAHSYDGGETWTTVNATPNDPVQGEGGICTGGLGCGSNRNLLDFNEVTMDDRGRVLFSYDDGCVSDTCLQSDGELNDFVAHWRVARQIGGRPLLAEFDPVEPAAPQAPFLEGERAVAKAELAWRAPNDGGAEITAYRILRGTRSGELSEIATVGGDKLRYTDAAADASVSRLFYQVVAQNAQGTSPASNEVGLEVTAAPVDNVCEAPGLTLLSDDTGDSTTGTAGTDLRSYQLAQPFAEDGTIKLRFQINTDPGMQPQPPQSYWYVSMRHPDGSVRGVRMVFRETAPDRPTFESYVASPNSNGGVDGRFVEAGSEQAADAASFYDAANGKIVIVVPLSDLGLEPGDTVNGFNAAAVQAVDSPVGGAAQTVDEMPNGLAYQGNYTVSANADCAGQENTPPLAVIAATPTSGTAPLQVDFDGSDSFDQDSGDRIESYTFRFGDDSPAVTQSTPHVSHTYDNAGNFKATLTVTDSFGTESENTAQTVITVRQSEEDVTDRVRLHTANTRQDGDISSFDLRLENISSEAIPSPLRSQVASLQSDSGAVAVANADNEQSGAGAFWRYRQQLNGDDELAPDETSQPRNLRFNNPNRERFSVSFRILSGTAQDDGGDDGSGSASAIPADTLIRLTFDPVLQIVTVDLF